jgi:hypothetical protein
MYGSVGQRISYVKSLNKLGMNDIRKKKSIEPNRTEPEGHTCTPTQKEFSLDLAVKLSGVMSEDVLLFLIGEARKLLNSPSAVQEMPTFNNGNPGQKKYFVATNACKKHYFACTVYKDHANCEYPAFKKKYLCQHSICIAEVNGNLQQHADTILKKQNKKSTGRMTAIQHKDTAGKKGGDHRNPWRSRTNDTPRPCQHVTSASSDAGVFKQLSIGDHLLRPITTIVLLS